ncbi:TetR/AcrR family transcriptional regulator [Shewanella maritima]|uniref:TetR/AcrR family transcriptional regulator n=1 Tax=Shewanella maritima TaxID=2520507 RepID=UPI00373670B5
MARPRKSEPTRLALLQAGMALLTLKGYHGTGIKQILDEVNVPKGSFYNFFDSKADFVAAIIRYYGEQISTEYQSLKADVAHLPELSQLQLIFKSKVARRQADSPTCACLIGAMSSEIAQSSQVCQQALVEIESQWLSQLSGQFMQAQLQLDVRQDMRPEQLARLFYNHWQGSLLHYQVCDDVQVIITALDDFLCLVATEQGVINLKQTRVAVQVTEPTKAIT